MIRNLACLILPFLLIACAGSLSQKPGPIQPIAVATTEPTALATTEPAEPKQSPITHPLRQARSLKKLKAAPLYSFNESDVDAYLKFLHADEPDPIQRLLHLARKNIGQPYEIFLLG